MDALIGICPNCGSFVWGQVDGVPPIHITPTCVCFKDELVVYKHLSDEVKIKIHDSVTKVMEQTEEE